MRLKRKLREMAPTCSMGMSSSVHGTGGIDTYDPHLKRKPLRRFKEVTKNAKKDK
jgi:hypothetical protein